MMKVVLVPRLCRLCLDTHRPRSFACKAGRFQANPGNEAQFCAWTSLGYSSGSRARNRPACEFISSCPFVMPFGELDFMAERWVAVPPRLAVTAALACCCREAARSGRLGTADEGPDLAAADLQVHDGAVANIGASARQAIREIAVALPVFVPGVAPERSRDLPPLDPDGRQLVPLFLAAWPPGLTDEIDTAAGLLPCIRKDNDTVIPAKAERRRRAGLGKKAATPSCPVAVDGGLRTCGPPTGVYSDSGECDYSQDAPIRHS